MPERLWPSACLVIGAGAMGQALMQGWQPGRHYRGALLVSDPKPRLARALRAYAKLRVNPRPQTVRHLPLVLLAVKPQHGAAALAPWRAALSADSVVISVLAGAELATLASWCAPARPRLLRCMPNLPAALGAGALVFCPRAAPPLRRRVQSLFAANGLCLWLARTQEAALHAVTALSGSGPAYVYYLAELLGGGWAQSPHMAALERALAASGEALGLSPRFAQRLAAATCAGARQQLAQPGAQAARLRRAVTSPGGTTQAALRVLTDKTRGWPALLQSPHPPPAFQACLKRAVKAAAARAHALAAAR